MHPLNRYAPAPIAGPADPETRNAARILTLAARLHATTQGEPAPVFERAPNVSEVA